MSGRQAPIDLPAHPSLEWLRKTAKQLLVELRLTQPDTQLAESQLQVARRHGFSSWRRLVAFVAAVDGEGERLRAAVRAGDVAAAAAILDAEPDLVNASDDRLDRERPSDEPGMSLLHLAIADDHLPIVDLLIARGANLDARNRGGRTPLHDCFELGRDPIANRLIAAGATIDVCAAAAYGHHARLKAILTADPAQANDLSTHESPLGWAAYACDPTAAEILIAHGAIIDRPPHDAAAWRPVCMTAAAPVAKVLLARGADPNFQDDQGRTPLHLVLSSRLVQNPSDLVRLLLEAGADPDRKNQAGKTPLEEAEARQGEPAETYFPRRTLGPRNLEEAIHLLREASRGK